MSKLRYEKIAVLEEQNRELNQDLSQLKEQLRKLQADKESMQQERVQAENIANHNLAEAEAETAAAREKAEEMLQEARDQAAAKLQHAEEEAREVKALAAQMVEQSKEQILRERQKVTEEQQAWSERRLKEQDALVAEKAKLAEQEYQALLDSGMNSLMGSEQGSEVEQLKELLIQEVDAKKAAQEQVDQLLSEKINPDAGLITTIFELEQLCARQEEEIERLKSGFSDFSLSALPTEMVNEKAHLFEQLKQATAEVEAQAGLLKSLSPLPSPVAQGGRSSPSSASSSPTLMGLSAPQQSKCRPCSWESLHLSGGQKCWGAMMFKKYARAGEINSCALSAIHKLLTFLV